ncbi:MULTISPECIES: chemotaxis response regulator protein-glutamate methylesterase [unclassified Halorhabdus]|uniref:protein-glutamate methylesterase/protein-glutamine glutaminase n=1 Tax=unclassified Halorhabdus TaxID=2621901 RepID=UPI0023DB09CD|nr:MULTISPECIES: chemotaxis response regulator protein-glutamate methylesterase [unclassified Halorhabdus]WEL16862.1 Two-component system, chemotaxis family, protein-glutamate methylesterase/glutaminase [Halorhabdus sp. SVX81]WEL20736.1 Two-component system, chemotaxis family, protein-glutamate methylesterase/glutaminase [Halorhabdus sp. BNX81]
MSSRSSPRAVVADDSHFMRSVISDILAEGGIEVVATARDGREAIDAVGEHDPDVVTMDVEMPEMNGIEAVERIMAEQPTPILMLSAHTDENADVTFEALEKGAVDFFTKPGGEVSMEMSRLKDQLVEMVLSVAEVDVTTDAGRTEPASRSEPTLAPGDVLEDATLVIGSSTGGPTVVEQILSELPAAAELRILIVQHMPTDFTGRFAARLNKRSEYAVREAGDGDRIGGGEALVAAGGRHMVVSNYRSGRLRVALTDEDPVNSVRPSVDVTMESAAEVIDDPLVGVILTGMGTDGAAGIRAIKAAGGATFAQDEASSAVYGMPKRAVETGQVDEICPLDDLSDRILEAIQLEGH